ncbi:hypothetical protein [Rhizobium grahamii]|uniref:Uncharacterized protein n=1 Tax=Rhizobium grahamii CCGE 502 TaxID=990285 RepID=S3H3N0_9HYPH|nr:hypothetical protein [Rhizobium grahamii]EPE93772.1 hypothetical protein RGCCGE502_33276 [Rhizobium grahamii CCGE 502]
MHRARRVSGKAWDPGNFSNIDPQILQFEGGVAARQIIERASLSVIQVEIGEAALLGLDTPEAVKGPAASSNVKCSSERAAIMAENDFRGPCYTNVSAGDKPGGRLTSTVSSQRLDTAWPWIPPKRHSISTHPVAVELV